MKTIFDYKRYIVRIGKSRKRVYAKTLQQAKDIGTVHFSRTPEETYRG